MVSLILIGDVVEIRRLLIQVIQRFRNHRAFNTSNKYFQYSMSNVFKNLILKNMDGICFLWRRVMSSRAERNIYISCLSLMNDVWF
jgi:hypothetical protein